MKVVIRRAARAALATLAVLAVGCGGDLNEVTGTVTLNGEPVKGLEVRFEPVDPAIGTTAIGYTQADGSYQLHYPGEKTGAPAGEYTVHVSGGENGEDDGPPVRVAAEFNSKSKLTAAVKSGPNTFNFEVTSGGKQNRKIDMGD